jgi:Tfp pilus assembly protein PilF
MTMLTNPNLSHRLVAVAVLAVSAVSGCAQLASSNRLKPHSSAGLLDSGTTTRVTRKQAADVQIAMARTLEESDQLAEAEAGYREALKHDSKRADAYHRLAILCDRKGDFKEAEDHYASALRLDPKNPEILCDRAYGYYLQRRWADAEAGLRQALAIEPRHPRSHNNLGLVLARQGKRQAALAEFARAGCDPSDAQTNLGLVLALEGNFKESANAYGEALALKPKSPIAKEGVRAAKLAAKGRPKTTDSPQAIAAAPRVDSSVKQASASTSTQ